DRAHRHAAGIAPAIGNNAEGAAVVATILHLQEGAGAAVETVHELRGGFFDAHNVVDADALRARHAEIGIAGGLKFFLVADDLIDFGHGGIGFGLHLRGASGDNDAGIGAGAAGLADRLFGLAHGFGGNGAGIDDDGVGQSGFGSARLDCLGFIGV